MTQSRAGRARLIAYGQSLPERCARLEQRRRVGAAVAATRRFFGIGGASCAGLIAIELFTTVLPLIILGFGYFSGFATDASVGNVFVHQLDLHGQLEQTVRAAFGTAKGLKSSWTILGMAGFLVWGIPMSITVAGVFARAWQRAPLPVLAQLWRGATWFVLYLSTLVVHDRIAFASQHAMPFRLVLFVVSLIPTWAFWSYTPTLLVRDGGRAPRYLVRAGLAGVVIDGIVLFFAARLFLPLILAGWTGFGPIGVAMALMTWCGVLGVGWVATACVGAVLWERSAPAQTVLAVQARGTG